MIRLTKNTVPNSVFVVEASGPWVVTVDGKKMLDASSQTFNTIFGHKHAPFENAISDRLRGLNYLSSRYQNVLLEDALEAMSRLIRDSSAKRVSFKISSGTLANEHALKACRKTTGKKNIFSLENSYFGQSFETMRISGRHFDKPYLGKRNAAFFPTPHCARCPLGMKVDTCHVECLGSVKMIFERLEGDVAAFMVEPIMMEAGVIVLPDKFLQRLRELCTELKIALIYDEVQTCGGWVGQYLAQNSVSLEHEPDITSLGKALGAGFPLGAVIVHEAYDVIEYGEHEITYGGYLPGLAAFIEATNILAEEATKKQFSSLSHWLDIGLHELKEKCPEITATRGKGLIRSVEFEHATEWDRLSLHKRLCDFGILARVTRITEDLSCIQIKLPIVCKETDVNVLVGGISAFMRSL